MNPCVPGLYQRLWWQVVRSESPNDVFEAVRYDLFGVRTPRKRTTASERSVGAKIHMHPAYPVASVINVFDREGTGVGRFVYTIRNALLPEASDELTRTEPFIVAALVEHGS